MQALTIPIKRRRQFIALIHHSDPQLARYTKDQWQEWYAVNPLSEEHMDKAVKSWKTEFPMNEHTHKEIAALRKEATRASKTRARKLLHGAFSAYLQHTCINKQLALACLKGPTAKVQTLLKTWAEYMRSPQHEAEKYRSRNIDLHDAEAVQEKCAKST